MTTPDGPERQRKNDFWSWLKHLLLPIANRRTGMHSGSNSLQEDFPEYGCSDYLTIQAKLRQFNISTWAIIIKSCKCMFTIFLVANATWRTCSVSKSSSALSWCYRGPNWNISTQGDCPLPHVVTSNFCRIFLFLCWGCIAMNLRACFCGNALL